MLRDQGRCCCCGRGIQRLQLHYVQACLESALHYVQCHSKRLKREQLVRSLFVYHLIGIPLTHSNSPLISLRTLLNPYTFCVPLHNGLILLVTATHSASRANSKVIPYYFSDKIQQNCLFTLQLQPTASMHVLWHNFRCWLL